MDRLQSSVETITKESEEDESWGKSTSLPIDSLQPGSNQPRRKFEDAELEELAESIKQQGLIQPVVVRSLDDDNYEILAGERRWRACKMLGRSTINVVIKDVDDQAALAISLIENIQRENLNPIEEAEGYQKLIDDFKLKQSVVSELVGKSRSRVSRLLSLLSLPDSARALISDGELKGAHGIVLASHGLEESEVKKFAGLAIKGGWSRDRLEQSIQQSKAPKEPRAPASEPTPVDVVPLPEWVNEFCADIDSVNEDFGWQVVVNFDRESQQAQLTIPFTLDDLEDFEDATHHVVNALRRIKRNQAGY
jgi:ParB family chromosome partitioning protein